MRTIATAVCVAIAIVICVVGMIAPALVDARYWWPRRCKR